MTMPEDPPLRSPERTPDLASRWRTWGGGGSVSWNALKLPLLFFSLENWIYSVGIRSDGATWAPRGTRARLGGGPPWCLVGSRCPPPVGLGSSIFYLFHKKSPKSFVQLELLFLHKNNTMVVLLKTASVRVSFIQIMQIRVQNKSKSIRKSRYDRDVSTPQA